MTAKEDYKSVVLSSIMTTSMMATTADDAGTENNPRNYDESSTKSKAKKQPNNNKKKKQIANRARHRIRSISRDARRLFQIIQDLCRADETQRRSLSKPLIIPNERCGIWYISPEIASLSYHQGDCCHFKSTDGHYDTWNFSFKRLNLHLLDLLYQNEGRTNHIILVDSSVRKVLPDSFARTIPIWATVLNRIAVRYRQEFGENEPETWDSQLYTPNSVVSADEHQTIATLLDQHVENLYQCKAIVNPYHLLKCLTKPLRTIWITNGGSDVLEPSWNDKNQDDYFWLVCVNPSTYDFGPTGKNQIRWVRDDNLASEDDGYYYVPGAADDHESWARNLTPDLLWQHHDILMDPTTLVDAEIDQRIDTIVSEARTRNREGDADISDQHDGRRCMDQIGNLSLWIGSRRAGRPPNCWKHFDAILNVTDQEYDGMTNVKYPEGIRPHYYYLQLPVAEGKRDRTELERWMPVGLLYLVQHLQQGHRVLVHCNQGRDRSVAIVLAFVAISCPLIFPVSLEAGFESWNVCAFNDFAVDHDNFHKSSGLQAAAVASLLSDDGRETFLKWVHAQKEALSMQQPLTDKERLRIALHLIRQDRTEAEPSRSTMQKINRFFMSNPIYRTGRC